MFKLHKWFDSYIQTDVSQILISFWDDVWFSRMIIFKGNQNEYTLLLDGSWRLILAYATYNYNHPL